MAEQVNQGAYRMSGRFGEVFMGGRKLMEVTQIEATVEIGVVDVPVPGLNRSGTKDGPETRSGSMTVQHIDSYWQRVVKKILSSSLDERRAARDSGNRLPRVFTLQIWIDDPDALGAEGWQIEGVRLNRLNLGFNLNDELINRELPFRFDDEREIRSFERIGNQVDPTTGLPLIRYTVDDRQ